MRALEVNLSVKQSQLQDAISSLECMKSYDFAGAVDLSKDAIDLTSNKGSRSPSPRRSAMKGVGDAAEDGGNVAKMIRRIGEVTAKNLSLLRTEAGLQLEISNLQ